jgi:uncharacterized protein (DUF305 family)
MTDLAPTRPSTSPGIRVPRAFLWIFIGLLAVGAAWFFGRSSASSPLENSPEVRFTRDMRAHHEQAVDMSLRLLRRTQDRTLEIFLTDIVLTQQNQIGQMTGWLSVWGRSQNGKDPPMLGMGTSMGMASQSDLQRLSSLPVREAEVLFLQLMHKHHQGGVMMAEELFDHNPNIVAARMAQGILTGQRYELKLIESMLRARNASIPDKLPPMNMTPR